MSLFRLWLVLLILQIQLQFKLLLILLLQMFFVDSVFAAVDVIDSDVKVFSAACCCR